jgi:hypothetical protein
MFHFLDLRTCTIYEFTTTSPNRLFYRFDSLFVTIKLHELMRVAVRMLSQILIIFHVGLAICSPVTQPITIVQVIKNYRGQITVLQLRSMVSLLG